MINQTIQVIYSKAVHRIRIRMICKIGSGFAKICGSTEPDPKIFTKTAKKKLLSNRGIRKILASWNRIRKNRRIHGSGSKGENIYKKLQKKIYSQTPNLNFKKKRDNKISWFLNSSSSFSIKISEKRTKNWKFCFIKKIQ